MAKIYGHHSSSSTVSFINRQFYSQMKQWRAKDLEEHYLVVYTNAIHQKVCRETISTEAVYVLLGLKEDYTKEVIWPIEYCNRVSFRLAIGTRRYKRR